MTKVGGQTGIAAPAEAERVPEWSQLRERLFDKWNL